MSVTLRAFEATSCAARQRHRMIAAAGIHAAVTYMLERAAW